MPLALATGLVDETSNYEQLQWSYLFSSTNIHSPTMLSLLYQLQHIDLAICWLRDPEGIVEHNLLLAGIPKVIIAPGRPPESQQIPIVAYLAETIGLLPHLKLPYKLPLTPDTSDTLSKSSTDYSSIRPIAIHPGSGSVQKCWPISSFVTLIEQLYQQNYPILLLTGPADQERLHYIQQKLIHTSQLSQTSLTSMLTSLSDAPLLQVAQLLQQCRCYIGNDSGITHLSSILGIPTIALFGPTDPAIWQPVGPDVTIIQAWDLKNVSVETVLKNVLPYL